MKRVVTCLFLLPLSALAACQVIFIDFEAGVNGERISTAALTNSAYFTGTPWTLSSWDGSYDGMTNDNTLSKPLSGHVNLNSYCGPWTPRSTVRGPGSMSLKSDLATDGNQCKTTPPASSTNASGGFWFYTDMPYTNGINYDIFTIYSNTGGDFANVVFQINGGGTRFWFQLETIAGGGAPHPTVDNIERLKWYWVTIAHKVNGSNSIAIYNEDMTLFGAAHKAWTSANNSDYATFGGSSIATGTAIGNMWMDSIVFDFSDVPQYPIIPNTGIVTNYAFIYTGSLTNYLGSQ